MRIQLASQEAPYTQNWAKLEVLEREAESMDREDGIISRRKAEAHTATL